MKWFVNYQEDPCVSVANRGFAYGDGVFETLLVHQGEIQLQELHIERLLRGLRRLHFKFSLHDIDQLFSFIMTQLNAAQLSEGVKVIMSRGEGGRGYLPPSNSELTIAIGFFSYDIPYDLQANGVKIKKSQIPTTINRNLSGLKHLNRLENVLAKNSLGATCYEAVMADDDGFLVECIQSNIFWFKDGLLHTPLLNRSGVQGSLRNYIINQYGSFDICVGQYVLNDLIQADEVFICNSLIGIVPVIEFEGSRVYNVGSNTRRLQTNINI